MGNLNMGSEVEPRVERTSSRLVAVFFAVLAMIGQSAFAMPAAAHATDHPPDYSESWAGRAVDHASGDGGAHPHGKSAIGCCHSVACGGIVVPAMATTGRSGRRQMAEPFVRSHHSDLAGNPPFKPPRLG